MSESIFISSLCLKFKGSKRTFLGLSYSMYLLWFPVFLSLNIALWQFTQSLDFWLFLDKSGGLVITATTKLWPQRNYCSNAHAGWRVQFSLMGATKPWHWYLPAWSSWGTKGQRLARNGSPWSPHRLAMRSWEQGTRIYSPLKSHILRLSTGVLHGIGTKKMSVKFRRRRSQGKF